MVRSHATKSFQKSFAVSIGMELETYGVGVTCIMPGAVYDTSFLFESNMNDALIWKIPCQSGKALFLTIILGV